MKLNMVYLALGAWLQIILSCSLARGSGGPEENPYVKTVISMSRPTVRAGETADILVQFVPVRGIHITIRPPTRIDLDQAANISISGTLRQAIDTATGYLASDVPVRQPFRVASRSNPGTSTIKGTCTYFFCSDTEGWCRKFSQPIEFTLTVTK